MVYYWRRCVKLDFECWNPHKIPVAYGFWWLIEPQATVDAWATKMLLKTQHFAARKIAAAPHCQWGCPDREHCRRTWTRQGMPTRDAIFPWKNVPFFMEKRGKVDFIPFEDGSQHVHHVFSIKMSRSPSCSNQHMCFHGKSPKNGAFKGKNHRDEIVIFQQAMVDCIHPGNHKKLGIKPLRIEIQYELTILYAD